MKALLLQLLTALLWLPLLLSRPFLRRRRRRAARHRHQRRPCGRKIRKPSAAETAARLDTVAVAAARRVGPPAERVQAMRASLQRALDAEVSHRKTYRNLARFERKLGESGLQAIEAIPVADLRRALRDFEALVRNWSEVELADLRSRMAVTLADRSSAASMWIAANSVSSAFRPPPGSAA